VPLTHKSSIKTIDDKFYKKKEGGQNHSISLFFFVRFPFNFSFVLAFFPSVFLCFFLLCALSHLWQQILTATITQFALALTLSPTQWASGFFTYF